MELIIEQALQQGLAAHKEGMLQEAERLYKAILQAEPTHPDANHNLGVIAVSVNKVELALPLLKIALEANPKKEQFWLSYIDALIKENQLETAKAVFEQSRKMGLAGEKIDALEAQLKPLTQSAPPKLPEKKKSLTLKDKRKKIAQDKKQRKQAKNKSANGASPSQSQLDNLRKQYQIGQYDEAEKLAIMFTQQFSHHQLGWKVLGAVFSHSGRLKEALYAKRRAVQLAPQNAEAHNNLGNTMQELGKTKEAELSYRKAIALNPDLAEAHNNLVIMLQKLGRLGEAETICRHAIAIDSDAVEAHFNLGVTLKNLGRLEEAEASYREAILLKSDYSEAHYNLGNALIVLDRLEEAEASYREAILLKSDYSEAHYNLGNALIVLGRLEEAEASYREAILSKSDFAEAYYNLGSMLKDQDRLEEAEVSYREAILLKPDYAEAHSNLGAVFYGNGDKDSALGSIKRANAIDPKSKSFSLLLNVLQARKMRENAEVSNGNIMDSDCNIESPQKILRLNRAVETELIAYLYKIKSLDLTKERDPSFGNTRGSDYNLFHDDHIVIKNLAAGLKSILMKTFNSDIFLDDSFFSIFGAGGGTNRHNHLNPRDKDPIFNLAKQKYSLVYYLSVGDQECSEPGVLKFYEPSKGILPSEGLIIIFPADRYHSSVYGGNKDRVIIGVNFYSL